MAPQDDEDWSDSDEEVGSEAETSVLLGVPDGSITSVTELADAAVSRIGGHPAFSPCQRTSHIVVAMQNMFFPHGSFLSKCGVHLRIVQWIAHCMFGVVQIRVASVKMEVFRAWRGLRYNEKYAAKLEVKLSHKRQQEEARQRAAQQAEQAKQASKSNPFSLNPSPATHNPFGLGAQIFGDAPPTTGTDEAPPNQGLCLDSGNQDADDSDTESTTSNESLLTAMTKTTLEESPWKAAPAYSPLYLSTALEYLPPQPKSKIPPGAQVVSERGADEGGKDISWAFEPFENSLEVDQVFERFTKRVGYEGEQCIRYELNGTPLPFASDKIFQSLFPIPSTDPLPITKPDFKVVLPQKRVYAPASAFVSSCPSCNGKRVFECQLMPNLINVLRDVEKNSVKKLSDEERRAAIQKALKGDLEKGMEWGTCLIFSCENDCRVDSSGKEIKDVWREEVALVQWDLSLAS